MEKNKIQLSAQSKEAQQMIADNMTQNPISEITFGSRPIFLARQLENQIPNRKESASIRPYE